MNKFILIEIQKELNYLENVCKNPEQNKKYIKLKKLQDKAYYLFAKEQINEINKSISNNDLKTNRIKKFLKFE